MSCQHRSRGCSVACAADHRCMGPKSSLGRRIYGAGVGRWARGLGALAARYPRRSAGMTVPWGAGVADLLGRGVAEVGAWVRASEAGGRANAVRGVAWGAVPLATAVWAPNQVWGDGRGWRSFGGWVVYSARYPRRSAGMTEFWARVWRVGCGGGLGGVLGLLRCGRRWVWDPNQVWGDGRGPRPLGGWVPRSARYPRQGAGMTDLWGARGYDGGGGGYDGEGGPL